MVAFFEGWRRKAGGIAFAIACMLIIGWIRSFFYLETARLMIMGRNHMVSSNFGALVYHSSDGIPPQDWYWDHDLLPNDGRSLAHRWSDWKHEMSALDPEYLIVPYWWIAMLCALLSAYLLLWKPPKRPSRSESPPRNGRIANPSYERHPDC